MYKITDSDFIYPLINTEPIDLVIVNTVRISEKLKNQSALGFDLSRFQSLPFIFLGNESNNIFKLDISLKLVLSLPVPPQLLIKTIKDLLEERKRREDWANLKLLNNPSGEGDTSPF